MLANYENLAVIKRTTKDKYILDGAEVEFFIGLWYENQLKSAESGTLSPETIKLWRFQLIFIP